MCPQIRQFPSLRKQCRTWSSAPSSVPENAPVPVATSASSLSEYGDEASLHQVRMEVLDVFDHRPLHTNHYVVLWVDIAQIWGQPLCVWATEEGYRHVLGFVEASTQDQVVHASVVPWTT